MEMIGRLYALEEGMEVVCLRIGTLTADNTPKPSSPENPQRWLSHNDCGQLAYRAVVAKTIPENFEIIYGVSKDPKQVFDYTNSIGYEPTDHTDI